MSDAVNHWGMTEEDLGLTDLVRQEIWEWRSVCQSPQHLLALGTIVSGLDALLAGSPMVAAATVSLDHVVGANSRSVSILLDEDALELAHSAHYYDPAIGGDGESEVDARFAHGEIPSETGVFDWLNRCGELRPGANELEVEIHAFPEV